MKLSEAVSDSDRLNRTVRHNLVWLVVDNLDEHAAVMHATRNVYTRHRLGNVLQVYLMAKQLNWGDPMQALKQAIKDSKPEHRRGGSPWTEVRLHPQSGPAAAENQTDSKGAR